MSLNPRPLRTTNLTIRLTLEELQQLEVIARRENVSKADIVRRALDSIPEFFNAREHPPIPSS